MWDYVVSRSFSRPNTLQASWQHFVWGAEERGTYAGINTALTEKTQIKQFGANSGCSPVWLQANVGLKATQA